ncbi:MAG: antitoxin [Intrasporangium sp.]|uniref:antitoxin n=1 Tax=Intrasporangium sp. TaxID=1925024 RepID=UPI00264960D8|nr:antitoxin [Intrasporangium sp.]MDN5797574.1 antitoxin [Intrasporangium sp.]
MRTTVTLDPDTDRILRERMRKRGVTFKQALNDSIRDGNVRPRTRRPATNPRGMGAPKVDLTKALQLADELQDTDQIAKLARGR